MPYTLGGRRPDPGGCAPVGDGPVADLAEAVVAPGPEGAVRIEGHRVIATSGDGGPVGRRAGSCRHLC